MIGDSSDDRFLKCYWCTIAIAKVPA